MCAAYAAIANNGYYWQPISFTRMENEEGEVVLDADLEALAAEQRILDLAPELK